MSEHEREPREQIPAPPAEAEEYRSASGLIFDGATALGAAAGGLGTLALGAAAVKQVLGSEQSPEPTQPNGDKPSGEQVSD